MRIHVLGSAAGGGFPQWNCNCRQCDGVRRGTIRVRPRTQSSIALSGNGTDWLLCNASPDILTQLRAFPAAQPARAMRDTGIRAVLLIDAQIDHTTGLCMLRESTAPLAVWCTEPAYEDLTHGHPLLNLLDHYCGTLRHVVRIDGSAFGIDEVPDLRFTALPLRSNAPPYSPHRDRPVPGDNIGLLAESTADGKRLFYAPGLGEMEPRVCGGDAAGRRRPGRRHLLARRRADRASASRTSMRATWATCRSKVPAACSSGWRRCRRRRGAS